MLNLTVPELIALAAVLLTAGGTLGYLLAMFRVRRQSGGKTPGELRQELEDYRTGVTAHFQETADLLGGMTEQYRAVYAHLARGASEFCDESNRNPRLSQFEAELLEARSAADTGAAREPDDAADEAPAARPVSAAVEPIRAKPESAS